MSLAAGSNLGPYEVVGPLGAGGMGEVEPFCGRERSAFFAPRMILRGASPQAKSRATATSVFGEFRLLSEGISC